MHSQQHTSIISLDTEHGRRRFSVSESGRDIILMDETNGSLNNRFGMDEDLADNSNHSSLQDNQVHYMTVGQHSGTSGPHQGGQTQQVRNVVDVRICSCPKRDLVHTRSTSWSHRCAPGPWWWWNPYPFSSSCQGEAVGWWSGAQRWCERTCLRSSLRSPPVAAAYPPPALGLASDMNICGHRQPSSQQLGSLALRWRWPW